MTDIYRFLPLTELHNLLRESKLKFARLMMMDDLNEGLGSVLSFQESFAYSCSLQRKEKIKEHHDHIRGSTYINSWTLEPDLMAMWLLYSKRHDSIRIKTTKEKLEQTVKQYANENCWTKHIDSPAGTIQLPIFPEVKPVNYVSFEELSRQVKNKYEKYVSACLELVENKSNASMEELHKNISSVEQARVISHEQASFLKDACFSHEKEIRASITICLRNDLPASEWSNPENHEKANFIFGTATHHYPDPTELPDIIHIPTPIDFIDAICFDPRAPDYIASEQERIIRRVCPKIVVEKSDAFGYIPDKFDFSLRGF